MLGMKFGQYKEGRKAVAVLLLFLLILLSIPTSVKANVVISQGLSESWQFGTSAPNNSYGAPPGLYIGYLQFKFTSIGDYAYYPYSSNGISPIMSFPNSLSEWYNQGVTYSVNYTYNLTLYYADGSSNTVSQQITNSSDYIYPPSTNSNNSPLCWFTLSVVPGTIYATYDNAPNVFSTDFYYYPNTSGGPESVISGPSYYFQGTSAPYVYCAALQVDCSVTTSLSADVASSEQVNTAISAAQSAQSESQSAAIAAQNSETAAQAAQSNTWYNSQSVGYWAYQAYQKAQAASSGTLSIQITGYNEMDATSASSMQLHVSTTGGTAPFQYQVNGGGYSALPANGYITVSVIPGANQENVTVKDINGQTANASVTVWGLP